MSVRVSCLMSVLNGERYLAEAIESMLSEQGPDDEIIVVDDGSTDATQSILARYEGRIEVITQANAGSAAALNHAVARSRGAYLAVNDADDLWQPGRVALQLAALDAAPEVSLVFGMSLQFVSPELSDDDKRRFAPPQAILRGESIPCAMMRRAAYDAVGPFDEAAKVTFGYSWLAKAKAIGLASVMLDEVVSRRRLHHTNWSRLNRDQLNAESLKAMREQILRRRAMKGEPPSG